MSQLTYFRDLVRNELLPRVIKEIQTADGPMFECELCSVRTAKTNKITSPKLAKHSTFCKVKRASEASE